MTRFQILSAGVVLALGWLFASLIYFAFLPGWRSFDFLFLPGQLERALARWDATDVAWQVRGTRTLDTVFPALYGVVLTAMVLRYWAQGGRKVLMLALIWITVVADYWENHLSLRMLAGEEGLMTQRLIATWIKFSAITWPMDAGLIYWWRELRTRRRQRTTADMAAISKSSAAMGMVKNMNQPETKAE